MEAASTVVDCLLEPFIDIIHGDVVLEDACCRKVGSALVVAHEAELRSLAETHILPSGLVKAIEVYCARSYLIAAPEQLLQSEVVIQTLEKLAAALQETPLSENGSGLLAAPAGVEKDARRAGAQAADAVMPDALLVSSGIAIMENLKAFRGNHNPEHLAHLVDALGNAVIGYVMHASRQCAQQTLEYLEGTTCHLSLMLGAPHQASLQRFVDSAVAHREAHQRAREAAQEAEVQQLLFGSPASEPTAAATAVRSVSEERRPPQDPPVPPVTETESQFSQEVHAAMEEATIMAGGVNQRMLKYPIPVCAHKGRVLHTVNSSLEEQSTALEQTTPLPTPHQRSRSKSNPSANGQDAASDTVHNTPSPVIVVDPSTLTVEMSAVDRNDSLLHGNQDEALAHHVPPRKQHRGDPVLIGASETSVLRMMENDGEGHAASPPTATASSSSSSAPLGGQPQAAIGGTPIAPSTAANIAATTTPDMWESVRQCVQRPEAESRSYFLCLSSNRFEPYVGRGFFS